MIILLAVLLLAAVLFVLGLICWARRRLSSEDSGVDHSFGSRYEKQETEEPQPRYHPNPRRLPRSGLSVSVLFLFIQDGQTFSRQSMEGFPRCLSFAVFEVCRASRLDSQKP